MPQGAASPWLAGLCSCALVLVWYNPYTHSCQYNMFRLVSTTPQEPLAMLLDYSCWSPIWEICCDPSTALHWTWMANGAS